MLDHPAAGLGQLKEADDRGDYSSRGVAWLHKNARHAGNHSFDVRLGARRNDESAGEGYVEMNFEGRIGVGAEHGGSCALAIEIVSVQAIVEIARRDEPEARIPETEIDVVEGDAFSDQVAFAELSLDVVLELSAVLVYDPLQDVGDYSLGALKGILLVSEMEGPSYCGVAGAGRTAALVRVAVEEEASCTCRRNASRLECSRQMAEFEWSRS